MKKILITVLFIIVATTCTNCAHNQNARISTNNPSSYEQITQKTHPTIVYITATGKKYHRKNCQYLKYTKCRTILEDAQSSGYTSCSVCNP